MSQLEHSPSTKLGTKPKPSDINYLILQKSHFAAVIKLATTVHGVGYMDNEMLTQWYHQGIFEDINAGYVAYHGDKLIGYRITFAARQWDIDQWSTPDSWQCSPEQVCYFKCNTIDIDYRGCGVGAQLLKHSSNAAKKQGASAGIAHLWHESPGNSAVEYFTHCGGVSIKTHYSRWNADCEQGYICTICGNDCHCNAQEMIIYFDDSLKE